MGNLCWMERNPRRWLVWDEGLHLKTGEPIVKVEAGKGQDDYEGGTHDITFYMRKDVYDKLIAGEYSVSPIHHAGWITVYDEQGREVPCIKRGYFY